MDAQQILDDLVAEHDALDVVVVALEPEQWLTPTPSPRWTVSDQIGHLTFFDRTAALAIVDPLAFAAHRAEVIAIIGDELAVDEATLGSFRRLPPDEQLAAWRVGRDQLVAAARTLADADRVEWYGPSMSARSFLTARLMETWAHGQDVCDAVGARRPATVRLRHIAQLGVITRGWSYLVRGETPPSADVRVELTAPSGEQWVWGPDAGADGVDADVVRGPAEDFCLVVTQRRHVTDTALVVDGPSASDWMAKAQAFAGGPTTGPAAGTRTTPGNW